MHQSKLDLFRRNPDLVDYANKLVATAKFKLLMEALRDAHPKNFRQAGEHIGDNAHYKLGRIDGYDEFENNINLAAVPMDEPSSHLEATFSYEAALPETVPVKIK